MPADTSASPEPVVRVLGPIGVAGPGGSPSAPRGARAAALVVVLALADGVPVPVSQLVDELWPDDAPADPRAALHNLVSRLRQGTGPEVVRSVPAGYTLGCPSDLSMARRALAAGRATLAEGRPDEAVRQVADALALWRGEPGTDLDDGAVAAELRDTAARLHGDLVGLRREAAEAVGDHATVVALASQALAGDPLDEDATRSLMTALAAQGKDGEAVKAFARLRHALVAELGTDPAPDLVALHDRLLSAPVSTPAAAGPTSAPSPPVRHVALGLRAAPNPLLGRDGDVVAVEAALAASRLVTVLGAGGLGKTRLAQEVARRASAVTPLVVVVELAGVRADDDVALALADALGLAAGQSARLGDRLLAGDVHDQVLARLRGPGALVVLDNCEHVAAGAARWASELLSQVPGLRILATSRAPMRVAAEQTYPLAPLAADGAEPSGGPAVELFRQRARAARPDVRLADDIVARLCDRLDGLPLAIELAAARVRTLSVEEIEEHLDARFALLRSGDAAAPDRHRTLEAVIEWSWNLLTESQRTLWRRVAVLPDGFGVDAAVAVGRLGQGAVLDVLDDVDGLVMQSLLTVADDGGVARYRMLETVRDFGLLRLTDAGEQDAVRDALLDWAGDLARRNVAALLGPGQVAAVAELVRDQENLLYALRTAAERDGAPGQARRPDVVVHVFVGLAANWVMRGAEDRAGGLVPSVFDAVRGWQVPDEDADVTAVALMFAAIFFTIGGAMLGESVSGLRALALLRRLVRDSPVSARTETVASFALMPDRAALAAEVPRLLASPDPLLVFLGQIGAGQEAENDGRLAEALVLAQTAYQSAVLVGDTACPAFAAYFVATAASEQADFATMRAWTGRVRPGFEALGAVDALWQIDWLEMAAALHDGDLSVARAICDRLEQPGGDSRIRQGDAELRGMAAGGRAEIALADGDVDECLRRYDAALASFPEGPGPTAPWAVMFGAARQVRLVGAGRREEARARLGWLGSRTAMLYRRWMPQFLDRPVLGTACLGAGATLVTWGPRPEDGVELLALSEALGSRQDFLPLLREPVLTATVAAHGATVLDAARARVVAMAHDDVAERALALLERLSEEGEEA